MILIASLLGLALHGHGLPNPTIVDPYPFQNPNLPVEERIDNLLSLMTLDEKIDCLDTNPSVPRLGIKASSHVEGLHGLAQAGPANWTPRRKVPTTTFPQAYGLGETWDADLLRRVAHVEGVECRYIWQSPKYGQGGIVVRAPNADLGRDPRWGRTEECYGEDPFLAGTLTVSFVKGLQGDDPRYWLTASLMKHFLANSNEDERDTSSSDFDERLWREYYSVPFRMGVEEGGSRAYMAAYNSVNGIPAHVHPMLKEITVKEWAQNGIICTDGGGYRLLVTAHKAFPTYEEAAAAVIQAGIGQFLDRFQDGTRGALQKGLLTESDIDAVLRGNFRVMIKLGILDPPDKVPYTKIGEGPEPWLSEEHKQVAKEATLKSIVLLKNAYDLLPLDRAKLKKVAVVGLRSNEVILDWYSGGPAYSITPLQGIKDKLGAWVEVVHALDGDAAVEAAKGADVAIVIVGNHPTGDGLPWAKVKRKSDGREGVDRESIDLEDEELIRRIYAVNKRTVLVLVSSFPYAINWSQAHLDAIVHMTHNSQEQGSALADVLFGDYNPAGRLTQTWPKDLADLPPRLDYDLRKGRTYMYAKEEPLYPFGFGLSYTTFAYSHLRADSEKIGPKDVVKVSVDVKNTGHRDGEEVVQLYVRYLDSKVGRPKKQLRGFRRVAIPAGQTKTVEIELRGRDLAYWDVAGHRWMVEDGNIEVEVGRSSAKIDAKLKLNVMGGEASP